MLQKQLPFFLPQNMMAMVSFVSVLERRSASSMTWKTSIRHSSSSKEKPKDNIQGVGNDSLTSRIC